MISTTVVSARSTRLGDSTSLARLEVVPVGLSEIEDAFHRLDSQFFELTEQALVVEPHPRIRALRAAAARPFTLPVDPFGELAAAEVLARQPADESLVRAVQVLVQQGPRAGVTPLVAHTAAFKDDLIAVFFRTSALLLSGERGARDRALRLLEADAEAHRGDWRWDGHLAMVRQEQRRHDEARELAASALKFEPRAGNAVHVLAHVNYETGEHAAGLRWLDGWQQHHRVAVYQEHFVWHTTLHLLAMGDLSGVLSRYSEGIGPHDPIDAGTLLWRCRLAGADVRELAQEAAACTQPILESLPAAFPVFNACFALAAAEDVDGLGTLCARLELDDRPAFADLVVPIISGLIAAVEGRNGDSATILVGVLDDLTRVGGSNAQREVVEDTLVFALVEDGRINEARLILESRLQRRPHAIDSTLLARASQ
jgi:hypothetical protein